MLGDTDKKRAVRILLECILVFTGITQGSRSTRYQKSCQYARHDPHSVQRSDTSDDLLI